MLMRRLGGFAGSDEIERDDTACWSRRVGEREGECKGERLDAMESVEAKLADEKADLSIESLLGCHLGPLLQVGIATSIHRMSQFQVRKRRASNDRAFGWYKIINEP